MKRYSRRSGSTKFFIIATLAIALAFFAANSFLKKDNDAVVAKVGGVKIFKSEIEKKLSEVFEGQGSGAVKFPQIANLPQEVVEIIAKEIYLEKQLTKEAKKSGISRKKEVKDEIAESKSRILRQAYLDSLIKEKTSEQKINEKYLEFTNDLDGKKEYKIAHIVFKDKEAANKISKELKSKKPAKFSDLAKKYSIDKESAANGGDLGYVLEDNMLKEIFDGISNLKSGDISSPIQTKFGWHLVKIIEIRDAKILPFESVKEAIRNQLIQDEINEINNRITKDVEVKILIKLSGAQIEKSQESSTDKPEGLVPNPVEDLAKEKKEEDINQEKLGIELDKKN